MIFIKTNSTDVYFNLAMEEYIFEKFKEDDIFILWINESSVVLGKHQNLIEEVNMKYCNENNIKIARRISGGGCVFHDFGNLNYSYITNTTGNTAVDFKEFLKPMCTALKNLGLDVVVSQRNDFRIDDKKICGHSQFMRKKRVLHHGCILFDTNLENLSGSLNTKDRKIVSKSAKSVRSKVANVKSLYEIPFGIENFKEKLEQEICKIFKENSFYELNEKDTEKIQLLSKEKYSTKDWIYGQSPKCTLTLDDEKVKIKVVSGKISEVYGDKILENFIGKYLETKDIISKINEKNLFLEKNIFVEKLINM